jgi:hypothetical protein
MAWNLERRAGDNLSKALAADGIWLVAGAPNHDFDRLSRTYIQDSGAAYIFRWSGSAWTYFQKISPAANARYDNDLFGSVVAISGTQLAVAAPNNDYDDLEANALDNAGAVWTWDYDSGNNIWVPGQKIAPSGTNARNANDLFGTALDIRSNVMVIGAPGHSYDEFGANSVSGAGAAWIFEKTSTWSQVRKVTGFGTNSRIAADGFGSSVSVEDGLVGVGAPLHGYDADGANFKAAAGAVWFFHKPTDTWVNHCKLESPGQDRRTGDTFGSTIIISGDHAAIGLAGAQIDADGMNSIAGAGAVNVFSRDSAFGEKPVNLSLNGTSDYIRMDNIVDDVLALDFTYATWVRMTTPTAVNTIFSSATVVTVGTTYSNDFSLSSNFNGALSLNSGGTSVAITNPTLTNGRWHHIVMTFAKTTKTYTVYQDGVQVYQGVPAFAFAGATAQTTMTVGAEYGTNTVPKNYLSGELYDLAVWKRALNSTEVTSAYTSLAANTSIANLVGNWVVVSAKPSWVTLPALGNYSNGLVVSNQFQATDPNNRTLTYNVVSGTTSGLTLSSSGLLSGTVSGGAGDYSFIARVTNSNGNYSEQTFTYSIFASDSQWSNVYLLMNGDA